MKEDVFRRRDRRGDKTRDDSLILHAYLVVYNCLANTLDKKLINPTAINDC